MRSPSRPRPALATLLLVAGIIGSTAASAGGPPWGYTGATGPAHWGSEDPAYAVCDSGQRQSPIDIRDATPAALPPIEFAYRPVPLVVTDTGFTIQVNVPPGSGGISVGGERYDLVQFHFHRPSEELIKGKRYPLVVHLVHKNEKGELAVVAVLVRRGKENAVLKQVLATMPPNGTGESAVKGATVDPTGFLPLTRGYYSYEGSLTIPPCSEHVRWLVLKTPAQATQGSILLFATRYPDNARPTQPSNGRKIEQTQ